MVNYNFVNCVIMNPWPFANHWIESKLSKIQQMYQDHKFFAFAKHLEEYSIGILFTQYCMATSLGGAVSVGILYFPHSVI